MLIRLKDHCEFYNKNSDGQAWANNDFDQTL